MMNEIDELLKLPVEIKILDEEQLHLVYKIQNLNKEMDNREAVIEILISNEKNEDGKNRYSNSESRKSAVTLNKNNDESYKNLSIKFEELKKQSKIIAIEISYKTRLFSALKHIIQARLKNE